MRAMLVLVVAMGAVCAPAGLAAQAGASSLSGVVRDQEGQPLARAEVVLAGQSRATVTDRQGRFTLRGVRQGRHRLHASLAGFEPAVLEVVVGGAPAAAEVTLRRTVLTLPGIQVTGTPIAGDVRAATQGTTQLSGRALEREMAGTVAQTLRFQPGVSVRSMGPAASAPVIRGLTGDRVLVLQDGMRAADLAGSADDHGVTIDPLTARRVEVVRGPATLLYGNNALGGVVNVISDDLPSGSEGRAQWTASMQSETATPGASGALRGSVPLGGGWVLGGRIGGRSAGDVRIPDDPALGSRLLNTDSRSWGSSLGLGYAGEGLTGGGALKTYGFAYGLPVPPGSEPVSLRGRRLEAVARAEPSFAGAWFPSARIDATAQDYRHDELDGAGQVQQSFALRTQTANVLLRQGRMGPFSEGAWGVSALLKQYAATGPAALTPPADSRGMGVFGFQEMPLGRGALQLGGRFDHFGIQSREAPKFGPGRSRAFGALSGSVGVRVPLLPGVSAGANLGRSFRAPTVEELFSAAPHAGTGSVEFGDPELRAERGRSAEAILQLRGSRWHGQFSAFRNAVADYVHLAARGDTVIGGAVLPVFVYAQSDATLRGLEGQIEWAALPHLAIGAMGDLIHAAQRDGTPLSFMPPARLGGSLRWDDGVLSLGMDLHHEFRQDRVGAADERPTDAHTIVRTVAGFRFRRGGAVHSITLRGENLGNALHREATSRIKDFAPAPGRNVAMLYRIYF